MIVSVGTVFSILPAPNNSSASQSDAVVSPEMRREVRIEVVPDIISENSDTQSQLAVAAIELEEQVSESESESQSLPKTDSKPKTSASAEKKPVKVKVTEEIKSKIASADTGVFTVPFFSQFADITPVEWKKVGCGIASLAMLVDFYKPGSASVDELLQDGIASGAYLSSAGWTHAGLINIAKKFGLTGESRSLADLSMTDAFAKLATVVAEGPVMVSVHYTFEPTNPIPHIVVVNGVKDGKVFYNDPAEGAGGHSLSIEKFKGAWKKRYISIRPV